MSDRLITALGALAALAIVYLLFGQSNREPPVTRPQSTEAGRNGYLGLRTWLEREGIAIASFQERLDVALDSTPGLTRTGNVLITTMPHFTPFRFSEYAVVNPWVAQGNTLLVLAALNDTPEWTGPIGGELFLGSLARIAGLRFAPHRPEDGDTPPARPARPPIAAATAIELTPAIEHPLLAGVESLHGFSDQPAELWVAHNFDADQLMLRLAVESVRGLDALWQLPLGGGQILVSASGTLLSNENIAQADARRLVANLLHHHLADGGHVIFDDLHQGLSSLYDPAAFFRDPRLRYTLLFIIAAWLVYVLGSSNRLAPPAVERAEPRQGDFLAAAGGFMARRLDPRAAGSLLLQEWFDEVRRTRDLPRRAEPPWTELAATPTLPRQTYDELRRCHERLAAGRAVNLVRLHNVLRQAREAIG